MPINDIKFLENIKQGFKRTISLLKYGSEITKQTKNNNLDYLTDLTFRNINRLFVPSFIHGNDDPTRDSFDKYYMPLVEIKDFNTLINKRPFFDQLVKNKHEAYEQLVEISRNNDYTTENLFDYLYRQKHYKLIGIDLSNQTNTTISQQISFTRKLEEDDDVTMFFVSEKQQKNFSKFVTRKWNIGHDKLNANYVGNETIYNTEVLKSALYDHNDAYILVRGDITTTGHQAT